MKLLPLVVVALVSLAATPALAERSDRYWVVGSFKTLVSATRESSRIENITGLPVRIARFDLESGRLYRLVIQHDAEPELQKQSLDRSGIDTWSVPLLARHLDFEGVAGEPIADLTYHLVVAAFRDESRADAHVSKLADQGIRNATVLKSGGGIYRVGLGPYANRDASAKRNAEAAGIQDGWWLELAAAPKPKADPKPAQVAKRSARPIKPVQPAPVETPAARPMSPPRQGESYVDYCTGRATVRERDIFCTNGRFANRVADGASGSTLIEFCASATASDREENCNNTTFSARILQ